MELKRKIEEKINKWYREDKKALLIKGARQTGKTHVIRKTLREMGCHYIEINLIDTPEAIDILANASNVNELIVGLSTVTEEELLKGKTVIFIDEVQKYKEMFTKVKFLVDEGSFRYIFSGSLLGIEITNIESAPVGYLSTYELFPLDFEEYLQITNISSETLDYLRDCFDGRKPVMEVVNEKMLKAYRQYLTVGGMPEAVSRFSDTHNLNDVIRIHSGIFDLYKLDYTQYEEMSKRLLLSKVYDMIPAELLKQNRRFIVSDIKKGLHYERVESTFLWLEKAGVAVSVYNSTEPRIPLKLNEKSSLFKMYLSDVGMLTSIYGMDTKAMILKNERHFNGGGLYENSVVQTLTSRGFSLYYYNSKRLGELDLVIEYNNSILPIEVKSGKDYMIHSAMDHVIDNPEYGIKEGIVFADCNIARQGKVTNMPIYMVGFLETGNNKDFIVPEVRF